MRDSVFISEMTRSADPRTGQDVRYAMKARVMGCLFSCFLSLSVVQSVHQDSEDRDKKSRIKLYSNPLNLLSYDSFWIKDLMEEKI